MLIIILTKHFTASSKYHDEKCNPLTYPSTRVVNDWQKLKAARQGKIFFLESITAR